MLYFLHGLNGYPEEWRPFLLFFSKRNYQCQALDFMKDCKLRNIHLEDYISKISSIITEQDIIIGHSMGSLILLKIAEKIKIMAGICICPGLPHGFKYAQISPLRQLRYIPNILLHIPFKPSYKLYRELLLDTLDEDSARKQYKLLQKQSSSVTYEVMKGKTRIDAAKLSSPLLFIATENDAVIPPSVVATMANSFHASFKLVPGTHYIFRNSETFAQVIYQFLQEKEIK